jgi:hypothetical protein
VRRRGLATVRWSDGYAVGPVERLPLDRVPMGATVQLTDPGRVGVVVGRHLRAGGDCSVVLRHAGGDTSEVSHPSGEGWHLTVRIHGPAPRGGWA